MTKKLYHKIKATTYRNTAAVLEFFLGKPQNTSCLTAKWNQDIFREFDIQRTLHPNIFL